MAAPTETTRCRTLVDLPTELVDGILGLLPTSSLARMRRVSHSFDTLIEVHCAYQCTHWRQRHRLHLEQHSITRPLFTETTLLGALRLYVRWNGGMPAATDYSRHAAILASAYRMDNDIRYPNRPLRRFEIHYYARCFEALLCLKWKLNIHQEDEPGYTHDWVGKTSHCGTALYMPNANLSRRLECTSGRAVALSASRPVDADIGRAEAYT